MLLSSRKNTLATSAVMMGAAELDMLAAFQDKGGPGCLEGAWELVLSRKKQLNACLG